MTSYFTTPDRVSTLQACAEKWLGTPFIPNACIRGGGVSCQKLVGAIYTESGFPLEITAPDADMSWSGAHAGDDSLILQFMKNAKQFEELPGTNSSQIQSGDLLGFTIGRCVHHLGIAVDSSRRRFIHCWRGAGVIYARYDDATFLSRIGKIWRPVI